MHGWENNTKMVLKETWYEVMGEIKLAQDKAENSFDI